MRYLLFTLFLSTIIYGQNNIQVKYHYEVPGKKFKTVLIFNKKESQFMMLRPEPKNTIHRLTDDELVVYLNGNYTGVQDVSYKTEESDYYLIRTFSSVKNSIVDVIDYVPQINWDIHPKEHKTILGYKCVKATTTFRGSNLVAYFTPDISTKFGPWKFSGLPGLILEISDQTAGLTNTYIAYEINFNSDYEIDKFSIDESYINFKYLINIEEKAIKERINNHIRKVNSKMPRKVKTRNETSGRSGFEKVYEWEEEEKEN